MSRPAMSGRSIGFLAICLFTFLSGAAAAPWPVWTITLHPSEIIAGEALAGLKTRHEWQWRFDKDGKFEVALVKSASPVPAPQCRMPYLILAMPLYYPETPKQASLAERRAVYDALLKMQDTKQGRLQVRTEPLYSFKYGTAGAELTTCNLFFVLPLDWWAQR
jgi:hypothetical protein